MQTKPVFVEKKFITIFLLATSLFMFWGIALSMSDVLNKHFQNVLHLSKSQSGLIQFSVFGAYFLMSIPAGIFMKKFGYKAGVLLGLSLFALGTFLFVPAANATSFTYFRVALFVLGCGMATLETVAHPFVAALGDQRSSDRRVNFAQSFNAIGTMIGPAIGTYFLLRSNHTSTDQVENLDSVKSLYVGIGIFILLVAVIFAVKKIPALTDPHVTTTNTNEPVPSDRKLIQRKHFVWAVVAQFFNVAAQAGTWSFFINYGHEKMHFTDETAGHYMVLFMGMMTLGRIIGTASMRFIAPNKILAAFAIGNILCCILVAQSLGWLSFVALLFINFFFSIMFPTIFSLGIKDLGDKTQRASSFISMGVVGGAILPYFMGKIANHDVAEAYYLPIICYTIIFLYGFKFYRSEGR